MQIDQLLAYKTLDKVANKLSEEDKNALFIAVRRMHHTYQNHPEERRIIDSYLEHRTEDYESHEDRTRFMMNYNVENKTK